MALQFEVENLEKVPEGLREHYKQVEGEDGSAVYRLDTDQKSRIGEFRATNTKLMKELAEQRSQTQQLQDSHKALEARFGNLDPNKYQKAVAALEKFEKDEERQLMEDGKIDELRQRWVKGVASENADKIAALERARDVAMSERDEFRTQVRQSQLRSEIQRAVDSTGVKLRAGAFDDVAHRVSSAFTFSDDGNIVPKGNEFNEKGDPITIADQIGRLAAKQAPHLFEQSGGSGSAGQSKITGAPGKRIIDPDDPLAIGKAVDDILANKAVIGKRVR